MKTGVPVEKLKFLAQTKELTTGYSFYFCPLPLTGCIILGEFNKESVDRWEIATLG